VVAPEHLLDPEPDEDVIVADGGTVREFYFVP
jgi:hypothetical protein